MRKIEHSAAILRKRKMLLVLPLLVLPFITMAFWALGGGKGVIMNKDANSIKQGLNVRLPDARLKDDKGLNKLSYYEIAAADSAKLKERMRNDPYFKITNITPGTDANQIVVDTDEESLTDGNQLRLGSTLNSSPYNTHGGSADPNEAKIMKKLKQLNATLDNSLIQSTQNAPRNISSTYPTASAGRNKDELDQFESVLQQSNHTDNNSTDPEMKQINGMLDKIMDIQHPDRIRDRVQQNSLEHQQQVFPVISASNEPNISLLSNHKNGRLDTTGQSAEYKSTNAFYSTEEFRPAEAEIQNVMNAVVHETQTIVSGSTVKLRLLNDAYINGTLVRKDNFVYGSASLSDERLIIEIKSIRYNSALFPVALSVCDMDGMDGIYIPGAIERTSAKESSDKAIQSVALNSLDPTLGTQAASAGIEAAKTLLSKKVKLIKVTIKAGYRVLLKDNNKK